MKNYLLCIFLLLAGCGGGSAYNTEQDSHIPVTSYSTGDTTWINQMGDSDSYMDYSTGETYYQMNGDMYMDSTGQMYQGY